MKKTMRSYNSTLRTESAKHREMRLAGLLPKKTYTLSKTSKKSASLWGKARKECLDRYNHKCFLCGATGVLHIHHIILRSLAPKLKYEQDNLCCLCSKCHNHTGYDKKYIELTKKLIAQGLGGAYNLHIEQERIYYDE